VPSAGVTPEASSQETLTPPSVEMVGSPPQQSVSFWHRLLVSLQPLAGWQILTPLGPGAQRRLQQLVQSPQTMPSWVQDPAPVVGSVLQTPAAAPVAFSQYPLQQSVDR